MGHETRCAGGVIADEEFQRRGAPIRLAHRKAARGDIGRDKGAWQKGGAEPFGHHRDAGG